MIVSDAETWPMEPGWRERVVNRSLGQRRDSARDIMQRLIDTALQLLDESGAEFTVQDVADRAGVSRRKFYDLFPSKDDLVLAAFIHIHTRAVAGRRQRVEEVDGPPTARLQRYFELAFESSNVRQPYYVSVARLEAKLIENRVEALQVVAQPWIDYLSELIAECRTVGAITVDIPDAQIAAFLQSIVRDRLFRQRMNPGTALFQREPSPADAVTLLLRGFVATSDHDVSAPPHGTTPAT